MSRKLLIRTNLYPYHVTTRCNNQEWFDIPMDLVWSICLCSLERAYKKYDGIIYGFVLMNNHYHLMIQTPKSNIDKFMFEFNRSISVKIRDLTGRKNRIFGDRYKSSLILFQDYYLNAIRYIFQNPLRAKMVSRCQDYPYSSLSNFAYGLPFPTPFDDLQGIVDEYGGIKWFLDWINRFLDKEEEYKLKFVFRQATQQTTKQGLQGVQGNMNH